MFFASDNSGPAHPRVMEALTRANAGYAMPYGPAAETADITARLRDIFEAPEAEIRLVATGTAANVLILATLTRPWQTVFCADVAHIACDECGAPEFYAGGAKLTLVPTDDAKMTPEALRAAIESVPEGVVHGVQRGPVSITTVTERGTIYTPGELAALSAVAREHGLPVHLDGARFANALEAAGCSPADLGPRAGIDAISFGATKNGCLGVEAAIFFDPAHAWEFELRRKRGAHLFSKHRFLTAQMRAYLEDDLWRDMARAANDAAARLAGGLRERPGVRLLHPPQANMIYAEWSRAAHRRLHEAGALYYAMGSLDGDAETMVPARLVCDWSASDENTDRFLTHLAAEA